MKTLLRRLAKLLAAAGVLVLLLLALLAGAVWLTLPGTRQIASIPGLSAPVDITYDADWVPRIHAATETDAATALGWLHASDRLFEMDLMRRAASGRLSEVAGPATLPLDKMMRTLGLRRAAIADYAALPDDTKAVLDAYARGVNAFIAAKGRFAAPEFLALGAPEQWEPVDSLLWAKTMGLWLSMNWRQELARQRLAGKVAQTVIRQLWASTGPSPASHAWLSPLTRFATMALPEFPRRFIQPQSASNEWAVDGDHTATGAPLLAGDPHLGYGFPGIWYLARIDLPGRVLAGATSPGVPFLVIGHNGKIAWTFTTTGADTQDIFIETLAGSGQYQTPDGPRPFVVHEERIKVRGQPDTVLMVQETRHGPVISEGDGPILTVEMANMMPGDTAATGLLALNRATSVAEAGAAAELIETPVQNLLVADDKTIGQFVTGRVPIRRAGDGTAPVPGDGSHDWIGWASGQQLPHTVSPADGRLVNANEPIWPPNFPVFMGHDTFGDWRARRIGELLDKSNRHTPADFAAMQIDVVDLFARRVMPILRTVDGIPAQLRDWDGTATMDSPAPLILAAWMQSFYQTILERAGADAGLGEPMPDFVASVLAPGGKDLCGGDCRPLLHDALADAMRRLKADYGTDPADWHWGDVHQAMFAHPLLRAIPVLRDFGTIAVPSPGDDATVFQGGYDAAFRSVHGPSFRGVYDLADLDRSLFMEAPGQSGNLFSPHARDFAIRWRDGATITLGPAAARITGTVRLKP